MNRLFAGYDAREAIGYHVFAQSLFETSPGVAIVPLTSAERGDGSNAFTYTRFAVPEMCGWGGKAIFMDGSDMLLRGDVNELFEMADPRFALQVVKHDYRTKHSRKYVGTELECENHDYPCKNWSSVMLVNCGHIVHFQARDKIRQAMAEANGRWLHRFGWVPPELIGELPATWNWLADEFGANGEAKLLHWTAGIPGFAAYRHAPHATEWLAMAERVHAGWQSSREAQCSGV